MSVRLAMLARDEADQMKLVAEACCGLYDDWIVLVDDRTTDETAVAANSNLAGAGVVEFFAFEDFSQARNLLLERAREAMGGLGREDFILLADPDSPPRGVLPGLIHNWYSCRWRSGSIEWQRPVLVRATFDCLYVGAAHELLIPADSGIAGLDVGGALAIADELVVDVIEKPFSEERANLYLELLAPTAPTDPRDAFYLARTYRDLGRSGEAIEAYLRCVAMPQWEEQVFVALNDAGVLLSELDVELGRILFERAHELLPRRGDGLYYLAWSANQARDPERAAAACAAAIQLPPYPDGLFVNRWAEREGILLELGRAIESLRDRDGLTTLEES